MSEKGQHPDVYPAIDWDDLNGWLASLDEIRLSWVVAAVANREIVARDQSIVAVVREVLVRDETDREPVAVVFGTGGWDHNYLDQMADVLYADGTRDEIDFGDGMVKILSREFGECPVEFGVGVDLTTGEVDTGTEFEDLLEEFGFRPS